MTETLVTKRDIEAAIIAKRQKQDRMPQHWTERRTQIGDEIDRLVEEWLACDEGLH